MARPVRETTVNALASSPDIPTLAHLLERLGGISPARVRYYPMPGAATVQDVIEIERRENRLCELVDGVLVEKNIGLRESMLAVGIAVILQKFIIPRGLGVAGTDGMLSLLPGVVRIPDVAYISRQRLSSSDADINPIPFLAPDLAIEILSAGKTRREIDRKRADYFQAGARMVWVVDPLTRTVDVYQHRDIAVRLREDQCLGGEAVLPGFSVRIGDLFAEIDGIDQRELEEFSA